MARFVTSTSAPRSAPGHSGRAAGAGPRRARLRADGRRQVVVGALEKVSLRRGRERKGLLGLPPPTPGGTKPARAPAGPASGTGPSGESPAPPHPLLGVEHRASGEAHEEVLAARLDGLDRLPDDAQPSRRGGHCDERRVEGEDGLAGERRVEGPRGAPDGVAVGHGGGRPSSGLSKQEPLGIRSTGIPRGAKPGARANEARLGEERRERALGESGAPSHGPSQGRA